MNIIKLGLTGSIGMGKTRTTQMFKHQNIPVFDADKTVHKLFNNNKSMINLVDINFEGIVKNKVVNRQKLSNLVFKDYKSKEKLENIVHPFVRRERKRFISFAQKNRFRIVLFDIPLLYETKSEKMYDYTIVVSAPKFIQRQRVLRRNNMTNEKFENICKNQIPDYKKKLKANYVIFSGLSISNSYKQVKVIINSLRFKHRIKNDNYKTNSFRY